MYRALIVKKITSRPWFAPRGRCHDRNGRVWMMSGNSSGLSLQEIAELLGGEILCGAEHADRRVTHACGCDLMSDVLTYTRTGAVLLTGLTNPQVVRTAEMLDLGAIVFVRDKRPDENTVALAGSIGLPILLSPFPLYESCGRLYSAGLAGCQGCGTASADGEAARVESGPAL